MQVTVHTAIQHLWTSFARKFILHDNDKILLNTKKNHWNVCMVQLLTTKMVYDFFKCVFIILVRQNHLIITWLIFCIEL